MFGERLPKYFSSGVALVGAIALAGCSANKNSEDGTQIIQFPSSGKFLNPDTMQDRAIFEYSSSDTSGIDQVNCGGGKKSELTDYNFTIVSCYSDGSPVIRVLPLMK